ncbi:MAG: PAS domain S-box protein [Candidatus Omnitrophica bacterium]|nr:PAS domain S-box protein [Candidatus Omnitrophota bacterium]
MDSEKQDSIWMSLILESSGQGICGLDLHGKTTFANLAAARMVGLELQEIVGKSQHSLWHHTKADGTPYPHEECPIYAAYHDGCIHRKDDEVFWRKDGTCFPVEYISTPMRDESGTLVGAVVVFSDITERKLAEEKLKKSASSLLETQTVARIGNWEYDVVTNRTAWSKEMFRIFGFDPEGPSPSWPEHRRVIHPEDWGYIDTAVRTAMAAGTPYEVEFRIIQPNHDIIWACSIGKIDKNSKGEIARFYGTVQDITDRKKTEDALKKAKAFNESALNAIDDIFYVFDVSGKFLNWNSTFRHVSGYTDAELALKRPTDFFAGEDIQRITKAVERIFKEGVSKEFADFIAKDGRRIPYELHGAALKDDQGQMIGFSGTGRDLTERKRLDKELQEKVVSLEKTNKAMLGRELRMIELKDRIKELEKGR